MDEQWKNIKGYEEYEEYYQVSNLGRVRSLDRYVTYKNRSNVKFQEGKMKSQRRKDTGYFIVDIKNKGDKKTVLVHRLVALAFINNSDNKKEVNHIDGCKTNNKVNNLEWCTAKENSQHARRTGLTNDYGENSCHAKLTSKQVKEIRNKYKTGRYLQKELAEEYNIGYVQIHRIVTYKRWKHLKMED